MVIGKEDFNIGDIVQVTWFDMFTLGRVESIGQYTTKYWKWEVPASRVEYDWIRRCWYVKESYHVLLLPDEGEIIELKGSYLASPHPQDVAKWRLKYGEP